MILLVIMLFEITFFTFLLILVISRNKQSATQVPASENSFTLASIKTSIVFPDSVTTPFDYSGNNDLTSLQIEAVYSTLNLLFFNSTSIFNDDHTNQSLYKKDGSPKKLQSSILFELMKFSDIPLYFFIRVLQIYRSQHPISEDKKISLDSLFTASVIYGNNLEIAQWLINEGADINFYTDYSGMTTLLYVARDNPNIEMLKLLINNGADLFTRSKYGTNALQFAAMGNPNPEMITFLLKNGFSISDTDEHGNNICMLAAKSNSVPVLEKIIRLGGNLLSISDGWNCLFFAVCYNQKIQMVQFLLSKIPKYYINHGDSKLRTPLMYSLRFCDDIKIAMALLQNGADPTIADKHGWNSLHFALYDDANCFEIVEYLLSVYKFDAYSLESLYNLPIFEFACRNSVMPETINLLIDYKIFPSNKTVCLELASSRKKSLAFQKVIQESSDFF